MAKVKPSKPDCIPASFSRLIKFGDILLTLRSVWLILFFNILAFLLLVLTPQGPDMILCIGEDLAHSVVNLYRYVFKDAKDAATWFMPAFWCVVSVGFWSISSEFCSRFFIYLRDNSGRALSIERVKFRKDILQKTENMAIY